ncbi:voltage-gated hydrogen channel 1 isoform 1-T1 [Thomomys bottae]
MFRGDRNMASQDEKPRPGPRPAARAAPRPSMSRFLRHFTVVGDDYRAWNVNYQKWENEEDEDEPRPGGEGSAGDAGDAGDAEAGPRPAPAPAPPRDLRSALRKLFSSHRFQVIVICLVILDALLVLAELILDLKIIQLDKNKYAVKVTQGSLGESALGSLLPLHHPEWWKEPWGHSCPEPPRVAGPHWGLRTKDNLLLILSFFFVVFLPVLGLSSGPEHCPWTFSRLELYHVSLSTTSGFFSMYVVPRNRTRVFMHARQAL